MSEFSQSYHLRTENKQDAVLLMKSAGKRGFAFEPANGWTTFVVEGAEFAADDSIAEQNGGLLAHYVYAEDHGWTLTIFNKRILAFDYRCHWEEELVIEADVLDLSLLRRLIAEQGQDDGGLMTLFHPDDLETLLELDPPPAYQIAERLGFLHFAWVSDDYVRSDRASYEVAEEVE
ncbi:hypothetical protein [Paenibacillus methanolicus]|uniref:Uncharacterized protein n=1 Tax=Paenibacillus methanolicus TaxID=582686 RepID=A0A5S5CJ98_9BACL|nr:hypothetical protein [Paenibacillus methanolicus]TYP79876.1 hypothetical protein BCM02_101997 [Paenibacillus methanolicus]